MHYQEDMQSWEGELKTDKEQDFELSRSQELTLLDDALRRLNDDKREILVLAKYQELKYEEIGSILNLSVPAVKVRVHRAMNELKQVYQSLEAS